MKCYFRVLMLWQISIYLFHKAKNTESRSVLVSESMLGWLHLYSAESSETELTFISFISIYFYIFLYFLNVSTQNVQCYHVTC